GSKVKAPRSADTRPQHQRFSAFREESFAGSIPAASTFPGLRAGGSRRSDLRPRDRGAGPARLSAAVYWASEGLRVLVVDAGGIGGQARSSSHIRNYQHARRASSSRSPPAVTSYRATSFFGSYRSHGSEADRGGARAWANGIEPHVRRVVAQHGHCVIGP